MPAVRFPIAPPSATRSTEAYAAYLRGMDYCAKYRDGEASVAFGEAARLDPDFPQPHLMLALYRLPGPLTPAQHLEAAEAMALKLAPDERALLDIARAFNREPPDYVSAERLLADRVARFPGDLFAWYQLAETRASLLDDAGALAALERVVALAPAWYPARNSLAYLYERLGRLDEALAQVDQYLLGAPGEPNPYDTKADILLYAGRLAEAERVLATGSSLAPDFVHSRAKTALLRLHAGDLDGARALVPAGATAPGDEAVWMKVRVGLAASTGHVGEMMTMLRAAAGTGASRFDTFHLLETTLQWMGLASPSAAEAREVVALAEKLGGPRTEKLRILFAARWDPAHWSDERVEAYASINRERAGERIAAGRRAFQLAWRALAAGEEARMTELLHELSGAFASDATALLLRGIGRLAAGDAGGAERDLARADMAAILFYEPQLGLVARWHRGRALEALGRPADARVEYEAVARAWAKADRPIAPGRDAAERLAALGK